MACPPNYGKSKYDFSELTLIYKKTASMYIMYIFFQVLLMVSRNCFFLFFKGKEGRKNFSQQIEQGGGHIGIQDKKGNEENSTISTLLVYCFINPFISTIQI